MNVKMIIAIGAAAAAAYVAVKKFYKPKKHVATVQQKTWSEEMQVQRYEESEGSGWTVPDGAYDIKTERRLKRVNIPRPSSIYDCDSARALDDILTESVRTYASATYQTWYTYKIRKWVHEKTVRNSGSNGMPTVDVELEKPYTGDGAPEIGMQRKCIPSIRYNVLCVDRETGEFVSLDVDADNFSVLKIGDAVIYKKTLRGKVLAGLDLTDRGDIPDKELQDEGVAMEPASDDNGDFDPDARV